MPFVLRACGTVPSFWLEPNRLAVGVGYAGSPSSSGATHVSGTQMSGHSRIASVSIVPVCITPVVVVPRAEERESLTVEVGHAEGQEEEPLALVRRADVRCLRHHARHAETCAIQVSDDLVEAASQMTAHVLAEEPPRAALFGDAQDVRPEVSVIVGAAPLAGRGEGLAGVSAHHEIHRSMPRSTVERSQVRPDRRRIQAPFFHARDKACGGIGFPLDSNDGADVCTKGELHPEVEPATSGAEGGDSERAISGT